MGKHETQWTAKIQKTVVGFALIAAKKRKQKYLRGEQIPAHVRNYFFADVRGLITDVEAVRILTEKSQDRFDFVLIESVPDPLPNSEGGKYGAPPHLDWDHADYVGDGTDGVYFDALHSNKTWFALATVDSDTGGFVDTLVAEGGYKNEASALTAARDAALEWCRTNEVDPNTDASDNT